MVILYWQVIFLALDARVKNIVSNYSLEHDGTDDLFTSIFHWLNVLEHELGAYLMYFVKLYYV